MKALGRIYVFLVLAPAFSNPGLCALAEPAAPAQRVDLEAVAAEAAPPATGSFEGDAQGIYESIRSRRKATEIHGRKPQPPETETLGPPLLEIVSWNMRNFTIAMKKRRHNAYKEILQELYADARNPKVLAAQEIVNARSAGMLDTMLSPQDDDKWRYRFNDSADAQNQSVYAHDVKINCSRQLFEGSGSRSKSLHPAQVAHFTAGDFDFLLINVHLVFDAGDADASARELAHIFDWIKEYRKKPGAEPDIIVAGDFNLPTKAGKEKSRRRTEGRWVPIERVIEFSHPDLQTPRDPDGTFRPTPTTLVPLVDSLTSRSGVVPANNYDHFLVTGDLYTEEYVREGNNESAGRQPIGPIRSVEGRRKVVVSDHFPIHAKFRMSGAGGDGQPVKLDVTGSGACE